MKKLFLFTASALAIAGCGNAHDTNWSNDCVKHHSETGREFSQCQEKLKRMKAAKARTHATTQAAPAAPAAPAPAAPAAAAESSSDLVNAPRGQVSIDPQGTQMESFKQTGKTSRGPESPKAEE